MSARARNTYTQETPMTENQKREVTQTAGAKLDRLERTMSHVLWASIVTAVVSTILAYCVLYASCEYSRVKTGISQMQLDIPGDYAKFEAEVQKSLDARAANKR